jgi:hypothetical protein
MAGSAFREPHPFGFLDSLELPASDDLSWLDPLDASIARHVDKNTSAHNAIAKARDVEPERPHGL